MEMESSRRSLEGSRSKDPGILKKPRLGELAVRDPRAVFVGARERPLVPRGAAPPEGGASRSRTNERERDSDSPRVVEDHQAAAALRGPTLQQMQELAVQYKTALAELTFNSKPIITNLTIIAGENLPAAKPIAAVICTNILEVPSEQKLPSLYLLDSIVKNIGRDYVKYFASRLPEVFCKAYKQVDPSIHQGMRHLFGTWKGVFPPAPLLVIEKELGFQPSSNGPPTAGTGSRPDPQVQRPSHSIHVNPKYLEARREQLQQPTRAKAVNGDSINKAHIGVEVMERADKVSIHASARQWPDASVKRPQREFPTEYGQGFGDREFSASYSRLSNPGRFPEREVEEKAWSTIRKLNTRESVPTEGPGSEADLADENQRPSKSSLPLRNNIEMPKKASISGIAGSQNWKNSEEEEFTWDLGSSRSTDSQVSSSWWSSEYSENPLTSSQKDRRISADPVGPWSKLHSASSRLGRSLVGNEDRIFKSMDPGEMAPAASLQIKNSNREQSTDVSSSGTVLQHRPGIPSSVSMNHARYSSHEDSFQGRTNEYPTETGLLPLSTLPGRMMIGNQSQLSKSIRTADQDALKPENSAQQLFSRIPHSIEKPPMEMSRSSVKLKEPLDESGARKLLAAIAKSGLIPAITSSSSGLESFVSPLPLAAVSEEARLPPLPLGPRPPFTSPAGPDSPPLSSLLSSLVAKGLISSATEPSVASSALSAKAEGIKEEKEIIEEKETPFISKSSSALKSTKLPDADAVGSGALIGLDFKPGVLREYHPEVINWLYGGVVQEEEPRFDNQEQIRSHFSFRWMFFNRVEPDANCEPSREWYPCLDQLADGELRGDDDAAGAEEVLAERSHLREQEEAMVLADESQCICGLCGEPFVDFYSEERDEWMYRGVVYYNSRLSVKVEDDAGEGRSRQCILIVHARCSSFTQDARASSQMIPIKMEHEDI